MKRVWTPSWWAACVSLGRAVSIGAIVFLVSIASIGCSVTIDLPPLREEETSEACRNELDDDLDGEMNCADPGCALFCFDGDGLIAPMFECFSDPVRGLAFREVGVDPVYCDPDPDRDVTCANFEHLIPGAEGCRRIGAACPEGWPTVDGARVLYVRGGADGDGSPEDPFGTLAAALAVSRDGDTIVLAPGEHTAARIDVAITLIGACAAETIVRGELTIASNVSLEDVSVVGSLAVEGSLIARGVMITGPSVIEGSASFDDVRFVVGVGDPALAVEGEATLVACTIDAMERGIVGAGSLTLDAVAVRGTSVVAIETSGASELEGVALEIADGIGLRTYCVATEGTVCAKVSKLEVTSLLRAGDTSIGLWLEGPSSVQHARVAGMGSGGIVASSQVVLDDVIVESSAGFGATFERGTDAILRRTIFRDHGRHSLQVDDGATLTAIDLVVRGVRSSTTESCVINAGVLQMTRFTIRSCAPCGLELAETSEVLLSDGLIADSNRGTCLARRLDIPLHDITASVTHRDNRINISSD